MKKTFIFYSDRIDYTEWMTNEEKGILFQTILDYQNWKDITSDNIVIRMLFPRIKKQLDDDNKKRLEEKESRSKAWKLWMEKRWNNNNSVITNDNSVIKSITKITDNVNVNVNVNDNVNDNTLKESNLYIKGVEDFIIFQKDNIPWIKYQIEKQWEDNYLQKQYQAYNKIISTNKITPLNLDRILEFVKQDKFRNKNIWSITKLLDKNKEWVPYWVVMIDKIKTKIDESPKVFKIEL